MRNSSCGMTRLFPDGLRGSDRLIWATLRLMIQRKVCRWISMDYVPGSWRAYPSPSSGRVARSAGWGLVHGKASPVSPHPTSLRSATLHPKSGMPDFGTKHVEFGNSPIRLDGEG